MLELDKRIKDLGKIYNCFNAIDAEKYADKKGYFAESFYRFSNLKKKCAHGVFKGFGRGDDGSMTFKCDNGYSYSFFTPEDNVEPLWRPFTLAEFQSLFSVGSLFHFRSKSTQLEGEVLWHVESEVLWHGWAKREDTEYVYLGRYMFTFKNLFDRYELWDEKKKSFVPFGVCE